MRTVWALATVATVANSRMRMRRFVTPHPTRATSSLFRRREHTCQIETFRFRQQRFPEVADLLQPRRGVVDAEVINAHPVLDFIPRHRHRNAGEWRGADGVDRRQRAA